MKTYGFEHNHDEPCVYKLNKVRKVILIVLYIDNIILIGISAELLSNLK